MTIFIFLIFDFSAPSGQSIPRHAVSTLCAGGDNFMPGSSMNCTVNADLMLRPVMDIDNATGFLMMAITSSTNISFFIYEFEGWCYNYANLFDFSVQTIHRMDLLLLINGKINKYKYI